MLISYEDVLFVIALLVSLQKDKNITTYNKKSDKTFMTIFTEMKKTIGRIKITVQKSAKK